MRWQRNPRGGSRQQEKGANQLGSATQLKQRSQQLGSATRYTSTTSKPGQPCVGDNEVVTKASRRQPKRSLAVGLSNTRKGANQWAQQQQGGKNHSQHKAKRHTEAITRTMQEGMGKGPQCSCNQIPGQPRTTGQGGQPTICMTEAGRCYKVAQLVHGKRWKIQVSYEWSRNSAASSSAA